MAPVLVSGIQPGPGLWKVSKNGHVLWVLGTVSPLPEHMQWKGDDVEKIVASSQQLLEPPGFVIGANLGFFGKLFLLPSMVGLRNNPNGATLEQAQEHIEEEVEWFTDQFYEGLTPEEAAKAALNG